MGGRLVPDLGLEGVQVHELEVAGDGLQRIQVRLCVFGKRLYVDLPPGLRQRPPPAPYLRPLLVQHAQHRLLDRHVPRHQRQRPLGVLRLGPVVAGLFCWLCSVVLARFVREWSGFTDGEKTTDPLAQHIHKYTDTRTYILAPRVLPRPGAQHQLHGPRPVALQDRLA